MPEADAYRETGDRRRSDDRDAVRYGLVAASSPKKAAGLVAALGPRMQLSCVYEPVAYLGPMLGEATGAAVVRSLSRLAERRGIKAAVVANGGAYGVDLLRPLLRHNLPVLWLDRPAALAADWPAIHEVDELATVVPALLDRYTGATLRLRELLVGPLGPVESITIRPRNERGTEHAARLEQLDWCRWLTYPRLERLDDHRVRLTAAGGRSAEAVFLATANEPSNESASESASESPRETPDVPDDADATAAGDRDPTIGPAHSPATFSALVECRGGVAEVSGNTLRWRAAGQSQWQDVDLSSERSALGVVADLFARRVIGGLVPTPLLDDLVSLEALFPRGD